MNGQHIYIHSHKTLLVLYVHYTVVHTYENAPSITSIKSPKMPNRTQRLFCALRDE